MTADPTPEPGHGPDDPDTEHPLTAEDILSRAGAGDALDQLPANESQSSKLAALANYRYRLVRGDDGRPYAVEHDGPAIAHGLRGRDGLRTRLASLYYETYQKVPGGSGLTDALTVLEGQARQSDPVPIGLRVAAAGDDRVVLDLGGEEGRCVIVDATGWRVAQRSPVLFRRSALTDPLPVPATGGSLDELRGLLNVDEARWRLIVGWLVAALLPDLPHPVLAITGEQGTAKSTAARFIVGLVDPSPAPLRTQPREMRSWAAAAMASWVVALDNISTIPDWLSDTLCKAVTGDAIVERSLHTDDDINVLAFRRVIALTSIDAGRLAGDLAERLLPIELERIPAARRRVDAEVTAAYRQARPHVLGALLDLTARVLAALPAVQLATAPRMADFARILAALDAVEGWSTFADYSAAAADASGDVLDSDPIAAAVCTLVAERDWQGTHAELLDAITPDRPPPGWPKSAKALSGHLKRLAPALRSARGVLYEHAGRSATGRFITLRRAEPEQVPE